MKNTVVFSPALLSRVRHLSPLVHVRYNLATMLLEPRGPNTDCIATFRPLLHPHAHTHTLSLSSLSLSSSGITTTHTTPRPALRVFSLWDVARLNLSYILSLLNSRAESHSATYLAAPVRQWAFSSLLSHSPFYFSNSSLVLATPFISLATGLPRVF